MSEERIATGGSAALAMTGENRTLEVIGAEIRALTSSMLNNIIEIGRRMVEAKDLLPHGEFGPWIKENTGYSHSTANNFMRLFNEYGNPQQSLFGAEVEKSQTFGKLSYTKALALLALPTEAEREEFVETHDVDAMSTRELEAAIRERDEARKAAEAAEAREKEAREELAELRGRPVDVAVQEPDPEVIEKRAQEIAAGEAKKYAAHERQLREDAAEKLKKAKEQAKAEREKLEAQLKAAEEKISAAGEADRAEAEKLRAEAEALRKQLAMSSQEIVIFKLRFSAWQAAHQQMTEAFGALDADQQEKMRQAIRAQIKAWGWGNDG